MHSGPDVKLARDLGQLPMTAATLAPWRHSRRAAGSLGKLRLSICNASRGLTPDTLNTVVGACVSFKAFATLGPVAQCVADAEAPWEICLFVHLPS